MNKNIIYMSDKDFKYSILLVMDVILLLIAFASKNYMIFFILLSVVSVLNIFSYKLFK